MEREKREKERKEEEGMAGARSLTPPVMVVKHSRRGRAAQRRPHLYWLMTRPKASLPAAVPACITEEERRLIMLRHLMISEPHPRTDINKCAFYTERDNCGLNSCRSCLAINDP